MNPWRMSHILAYESGYTGSRRGDAILKIIKGLVELKTTCPRAWPYSDVVEACQLLLEYDLGRLDSGLLSEFLDDLKK